MKSTVFATTFALAIAAVSAQGYGGVDFSKIPQCAVQCINTGISNTSCSPTDANCVCSNKDFAAGLTPCMEKANCSEADQQTVLNFANTYCSSGSSSSASPSATGSATGSVTGSATHGPTTTGSATHSAPTPSSSGSFDISKIPACAATCALNSIASTSCSTTDFECICKDNKYIQSLTPCIEKGCDPADQQTMLGISQQLCGAYGVSLSTVISASVTGGSTIASNSTTTHTGTTTHSSGYGNSTSTTSGSTSSTSGSDSSTLSVQTTTTPVTGSVTTAASTSTSTAGAAKVAGSGFVAAAIGAAFFML